MYAFCCKVNEQQHDQITTVVVSSFALACPLIVNVRLNKLDFAQYHYVDQTK